MWPIYLMIQISLIASIAFAIITPRQLYKMVDHVVDSYVNDSCLVVISSGGYTATKYVSAVYVAPYNHEMQYQNASLYSEKNYKIDFIRPILEIGCSGFVIQVENPGGQLRLIEETFIHVNQRTQRRFIFLPAISKDTQRSIGTQDEVLDSKHFGYSSILQEKSIEYIPDVIFTVPNDEADHVALVSRRFTGPETVCHQEIVLDTYDVVRGRFKLNANLFPDKVKDLEGKVLRIALFHDPPSVVINDDNETTQIDGTEWRFAQNFAERHNCSVQLLIHGSREWGYVSANLTAFGILGAVVEDKADLAMASLFLQRRRSSIMDFSFPLYHAGVTCLVPGSRQLPQWMSPILPFAPHLWLIFIGMTIMSAIFTLIVNRAENFVCSEDYYQLSISEAAFAVASIILLQGQTKDLKGPAWAALLITLLIIGLLVTTAYSSSLASAMTVPRFEPPIDTASELASSGIPWGATTRAWIFSIINSTEPEMQTLVKNFRKLSGAELTKHSVGNDDWGFVIERIEGNYLLPNYLSYETFRKMHVMKKDIYWAYCVAMLRKSSPFTRWYNQRVLEVKASGLADYWQTDIALHYLDTVTQLAVETDNSENYGPVEMTVHHLQGTFSILVIGVVLSSLVFLWELFTNFEVKGVAGRDTIGEY